MQLFFLSILACLLFLYGEEEIPIQEVVDIEQLEKHNEDIAVLKERLRQKFVESHELKDEAAHKEVLEQIQGIKNEIRLLQEHFRKEYTEDAALQGEGYAFWNQGETTLSQLILEYGSSDFLYIIPSELGSLKLHLYSSIAIPKECWSEMIEQILKANGIGLKQINPYAKQLYILKQDISAIEGIAHKVEDLQTLETNARVFYVFSAPPDQAKAVQAFFERFSDPKETTVHSIGRKVLIISSKESVEKLIGLYHAVWEQSNGKMIRMLNLKKLQVSEAEKVLKALFPDPNMKVRTSFYPQIAEDLIIMALPQGLVLIGEPETVQRGEKLVSDLENQLDDPSELTIFWYACKHSDPADLAIVLEKIYSSLTYSDITNREVASTFPNADKLVTASPPVPTFAPPLMQVKSEEKRQISNQGCFIVDPKTGSLLMVVRKEELAKIKALLKKLDVPKKMVHIEVLLVEKKLQDRKTSGINLLRIGNASGIKETSLGLDTGSRSANKGILEFLFARKKSSSTPSFDLSLNFLMAQEDLKINANPSVIAINQTPASISIVEEISINNGAILDGGSALQKSFSRANYGITLLMTPTIHLPDPEEDGEDQNGFITLQTNVTFDTTTVSVDDRPPVTRRHIENEVRIADGETIILGGLRRKSTEEKREKIPFLGDIPGIGKLFGSTSTVDSQSEMFIFITPKIIRNPVEDLRKIRAAELEKRAGDTPQFLQRLQEAKIREKMRLFEDSIQLIFNPYG